MSWGASAGFIVSDDPAWRPPTVLRFNEALTPWAEAR